MKPLYRFYMNLGIITISGGGTYSMFHFFGPETLSFLMLIVPFTIIFLFMVNTIHREF